MEDLFNRGLPKWPQMLVTGPRIREELALEVIRRTDLWFTSAVGCNDRAGDRKLAQRFRMPHYIDYSVPLPDDFNWEVREDRSNLWKSNWGVIETSYVRNRWIGSSYSYGPYGWCHPDGQIYFIDNVGNWPSVGDIFEDWQRLAEAFPFLALTATLMSGESCEDNTHSVVSMVVAEGRVKLVEPLVVTSTSPRRIMPTQRCERYPFSEEVMLAWERKAACL